MASAIQEQGTGSSASPSGGAPLASAAKTAYRSWAPPRPVLSDAASRSGVPRTRPGALRYTSAIRFRGSGASGVPGTTRAAPCSASRLSGPGGAPRFAGPVRGEGLLHGSTALSYPDSWSAAPAASLHTPAEQVSHRQARTASRNAGACAGPPDSIHAAGGPAAGSPGRAGRSTRSRPARPPGTSRPSPPSFQKSSTACSRSSSATVAGPRDRAALPDQRPEHRPRCGLPAPGDLQGAPRRGVRSGPPFGRPPDPGRTGVRFARGADDSGAGDGVDAVRPAARFAQARGFDGLFIGVEPGGAAASAGGTGTRVSSAAPRGRPPATGPPPPPDGRRPPPLPAHGSAPRRGGAPARRSAAPAPPRPG